jgi:hypothetical protein
MYGGLVFIHLRYFPLLLMSPTLSWLPATMKKLPHHLMPLLACSQTYTQLRRSPFIHESPSRQYTWGKPSAAKDPVGRSLQAITLLFPPRLGNTRLGLAALLPPLLILARRSSPRALIIKKHQRSSGGITGVLARGDKGRRGRNFYTNGVICAGTCCCVLCKHFRRIHNSSQIRSRSC